jgi:hypothetical protein
MANKDEIKHRISLEGADDVAKKLKNIGDVGRIRVPISSVPRRRPE